MTWASILCHNSHVWHLAIAVSFPTTPAGRRPASPTVTLAAWVVHGGWCGSDFNVVARCYFYYKIDIGEWWFANANSLCSNMLQCCRFLMSDVYIGRTHFPIWSESSSMPCSGCLDTGKEEEADYMQCRPGCWLTAKDVLSTQAVPAAWEWKSLSFV